MSAGETYEEFVEKFKPKKTTDDCYTPPEVFTVISDYVRNRYGVDQGTFCRPFYPGGDYQMEDYTGKVVVDNPPFSIQTEIVKWFMANNVPFFLFCSGLTPPRRPEACLIFPGAQIKYENGAVVNTAFVTNMEPGGYRTDPELGRALYDTQHKRIDKIPKKYLTPARLSTLAKAGEYISGSYEHLIKQTEEGKAIFYGAFGVR